MKKIQALGLTLVALFAFSAVVASVAFAEEPVWLVDAKVLAAGETLITLTTGTIELINKTAFGTPRVACQGILEGNVSDKGKDEVTMVFDATGNTLIPTVKLVNGSDVGETGYLDTAKKTGLQCKTTNSTIPCGATGSVAEVWPDYLPWKTQLELMADGSMLDLLTGNGTDEPGYDVHCVATGTDNLCSGPASSLLTNMPEAGEEDVLGEFVAGSEIATCEVGTGELAAVGGLIFITGKTLAISEV